MSNDARHDEEQTTLRRARMLGISYIDTSKIDNKKLYKDLLSTGELNDLRVVPLQADSYDITFGIINTTSQRTLNMLKQRFQDQRIGFALISEAGFREYMHLYNPPKKVEYQDISIQDSGSDGSIENISQILKQVKADDMLAYLVQQAHRLMASDIHMENQVDHVRIRYRIDGVLHTIARIDTDHYRLLVSAIASAANISTSERASQQGHISQKVKMADGSLVDVNVRLETVVAVNGRDVVMRMFNMTQEMFELDRLGLSARERDVVDDIIVRPGGLVMVVGPTGSGKTTTLYSMLNTLNDDQRKLVTIEDPVEYQFDGVTQISVSTSNGEETQFADKLRAVLRLDPDVVMVGEIRDTDTAKTALQASLTGHLVLSTFHASSASAALTRLMDVIGGNTLFLSAIRLIMAQRLIRRLDDATKQPYTPAEATLSILRDVVDTLPPHINKPNLANITLYRSGTSSENPYGYRGQIAVREQFIMDDNIRQVLEHAGKNISSQQIESVAVQNGMQTMMHDAILKVIAGETSLDEVYRVIG